MSPDRSPGSVADDFAVEPLWTPSPGRAAASQLSGFLRVAAVLADEGAVLAGEPVSDYPSLHAWSVDHASEFWAAAWRHLVPSVDPGGPALVDDMLQDNLLDDAALEDAEADAAAQILAARWFPAARLNVAERILAGDSDGVATPGDQPMFIAVDEMGRRRVVSRDAARARVGEIAAALRASGVGVGDRVAVWMPNTVETALVMLAAASIGAVFSSCSPDFGASGVLDRFGQIEPTVLVAVDGYTYGGRTFDRLEELAQISAGMASLAQVVVVGFLDEALDAGRLASAGLDGSGPAAVTTWDDWLGPHAGSPATFEQLPFDHPWYVLFSSGTTGVPKCIVHRAGGILLQHLKEHRLQLDIRRGDRVAYFTTCGWMMWNWLMSVPASGAVAVLYEGNPFHPGPQRLWDLVADEELQFLGVSAKFLDAVRASGFVPAEGVELSSLRTLASTGSPLSVEAFEWVYRAVAPGVGPEGLHLASISGGTDLCACFVCGDPTSPVFAGEIQRPALGMAVDVWTDDGVSAPPGARGELVCTRAFPSMPLGFWGDGPLGEPGRIGPRYHAAYFERLDGVWAQGDFATWTPHGGIVIHGRSDTTLNPGGVRIGTAEIYRQVEQVPQVLESLVFGMEQDQDVRIVLLVRLEDGVELDDDLVQAIKRRVREGCTPRHVPSLVVQVEDLPRTRSGKLVELAVGDRVNGREVRNTSALANPDALDRIAEAVFARR